MKNVAGLTAHDMRSRLDRITATDAAAVMGTSPWRSKHDVYLEKCVGLTPQEPSPAMLWGQLMEPPLLLFSEHVLSQYHRQEIRLTKTGCRRRHSNGVMSCTLDARVVGMAEAVEAKTHASIHGNVDLDDWGTPWTDEIPAWYRDQVLAQLACCPDLYRVWVVLSVGRMIPTFYCVERSAHLARIAEIENTVCDFWDHHIITNIPPGDSEPSLGVARRINVPTQEEMAVALPDRLVEKRQKVNRLKGKMEKIQESLDAEIRAAMAGATRAITPKGHSVRLATHRRAGYTVDTTDVTRMNVRLK